jgi:monoamine oxidase
MGHVVKVALAFRTAFWEDAGGGRWRDAGFFHCDEWTFPTYWTQLPVRGELIVAWAGGPKAHALRGIAEAELIERAANGFGMAIGEPRRTAAELVGGMTHDWSSDPFARGAYSYVAVGGSGARAALGAPLDGTIFFAGEATSTDGEGGTVNGALRSGERAADEVAASIA